MFYDYNLSSLKFNLPKSQYQAITTTSMKNVEKKINYCGKKNIFWHFTQYFCCSMYSICTMFLSLKI